MTLSVSFTTLLNCFLLLVYSTLLYYSGSDVAFFSGEDLNVDIRITDAFLSFYIAKATDENLTSENWEYILVCESGWITQS